MLVVDGATGKAVILVVETVVMREPIGMKIKIGKLRVGGIGGSENLGNDHMAAIGQKLLINFCATDKVDIAGREVDDGF